MLMIIALTWDGILEILSHPPGSTIFIMVVSVFIALFTAGLNKLLVDPKSMKEKQLKIKSHQKKREEIEKLKDVNPKKFQKEVTKWERQDKPIQKMQQSMSMARLKPTCVSFLPMIIFFYVIRNFYTINKIATPVAIPPMNPYDIPQLGKMMWGLVEGKITEEYGMINFTSWYFLCSMTFNSFVQRIMGLNQPGGALGGMMDQNKYKQYKT